jgi:DNA-binding response OmpR family regulator
MRILLVDLDQNLLEVLRGNLATLGFQVNVAESGALAIEELSRGGYTTVLVGDELADMSGHELCRSIRGNLRTHLLYLILMPRKQAKSEENDFVRPDAVLAKPFAMPELIAALLTAERRLIPAVVALAA